MQETRRTCGTSNLALLFERLRSALAFEALTATLKYSFDIARSPEQLNTLHPSIDHGSPDSNPRRDPPSLRDKQPLAVVAGVTATVLID